MVEPFAGDSTHTSAALSVSGNVATSYAYDHLDQLTSVTQGSQTRSLKYDSLGRVTRQKLAEQTATINDSGDYVGSGGTGANWSDAFVYDSKSNITQRTDARGVKTNLSYDISGSSDPLNRLQGLSYDTSTADTTNTIDAAPSVSLEYMTTGDQTRVKKITTASTLTEENSFDTEGRLSQYKMTVDSRTSYPFTTDYSYDTTHRLTEVDYPAQYGMTSSPRHAVVPSYDQASRLTQLNVDSSTYLSDISYNTGSQPTQLKVGAATSNPRIESYSYDGQTGLLTGQTVKNTSATTTYLDLAYTYSRGSSYGSASGKTGQLTKIVDNLDHNRDKLYEFDSLGRIMDAKGGTAAGASSVTANWTESYSYDRYGNKTGVSASGVDQNSAAIPADGLASLSMSTSTNRITTSGWSYDLAGNLIRGQNESGTWQKFEYDAAGRLKKVKDDSNNVLETYAYGAGGERLTVETSSQRTYYVWGGHSVVAEYTEATASTTPAYAKSYIYTGSRLLMTATKASSTTETKEFHHPDRLGTQLVTDGGAGTSYRQTTLPFGTTLGAESTGYSNRVFTSYDRSSTTGLDYATNRSYSPGQSRFTQVDPARHGLNLYAYVGNDPINFIDPSGLDACTDKITAQNPDPPDSGASKDDANAFKLEMESAINHFKIDVNYNGQEKTSSIYVTALTTTLGVAAGYAGAGAVIGSAEPGGGTVLGAVVGGIIGLVIGIGAAANTDNIELARSIEHLTENVRLAIAAHPKAVGDHYLKARALLIKACQLKMLNDPYTIHAGGGGPGDDGHGWDTPGYGYGEDQGFSDLDWFWFEHQFEPIVINM